MIIIHSLQAEMVKMRRSGLLMLAIFGTLIVNMMLALLAVYYPEIFTGTDRQVNVWHSWISFHYQGILGLLLPMYLVIISALSIFLENRNETWRLLYGLPVPKSTHYLAKLFSVTLVFIFSHLLFVIIMILLPAMLRFWWDALIFDYLEMPLKMVLSYFFRTILSSFGIIGLVFFVSYFSRSFVFPLAVGIIGFVLSNVLLDTGIYASWFPFSYPALNLIAGDPVFPDPELVRLNLYSILYYTLFLLGGVYFASRDTLKTR